jgi:hypothetical protein
MKQIRLGNRKIDLPKSRVARIVIGGLLIIFGFLGFLPILGFWMIPLGLLILSGDIPAVRRWRRHVEVRFGQWLKRNYPSVAQRLGYTNGKKRA